MWSKEAVQLAAGGVKRALLLLRTMMDEWPAVITDHAVENPVRRELSESRVLVEIADDLSPSSHRLSTCL